MADASNDKYFLGVLLPNDAIETYIVSSHGTLNRSRIYFTIKRIQLNNNSAESTHSSGNEGSTIGTIEEEKSVDDEDEVDDCVSHTQESIVNSLLVVWRTHPNIVATDLSHLKCIERFSSIGSYHCPLKDADNASKNILKFKFIDNFDINITFKTISEFEFFYNLMTKLLVAYQQSNEMNIHNELVLFNNTYKYSEFQATTKLEQLYQIISSLKMKEGCVILEKVYNKSTVETTKKAFNQWIGYIKECNNSKMIQDKNTWRLHASTNLEADLQAWYHSVFWQEVYRVRGPFWYKDAVLPVYKEKYDVINNVLSSSEEEALSHVLCSPDTSYGDVAAQMFVIEAIVGRQELISLFKKLASQGVMVTKYPRAGRPAKKLFRVSFVEGKIFLTWKGKFGNQGVDISDISAVLGGISSEVLQKAGQPSKAEQYLSLICVGRSIDLYFDTEEERNNWRDLMDALAMKENDHLVGVESIIPNEDSFDIDWYLYYQEIGNHKLDMDALNEMCKKNIQKHNEGQLSDDVIK